MERKEGQTIEKLTTTRERELSSNKLLEKVFEKLCLSSQKVIENRS